MTVYVCGTLFSVLFAYFSTHVQSSHKIPSQGKKTLHKLFAVLSFLPLTVIMAIRYGVGWDFTNYWRMYTTINITSSSEKGFALFISVCRLFSSNPQTLFIVSSIIICGSYFYTIYQESESPDYSVLLFVLCNDFFIAMNNLRQYMASAILLLAIPAIRKKKWDRVVIVILIAASFHRSVMLFIPALILMYIVRPSPLTCGGVMAGVYFLSDAMRRLIINLLRRFGAYTTYFYNTDWNNHEEKFSNLFFVFLCFFLLLSYEYKKVKSNNILRVMYAAVVICLFLLTMSSFLPRNASRVLLYANIILTLYIPTAIKELGDKKLQGIMRVAIIGGYLIATVIFLGTGARGTLPYQSFISRH